MSKKTEKPIKPKKNNQKNQTVKKNQLNRIKVLKKISVRFGFGFRNLKPEKAQPNRTELVQLRGTINRKKNRSYS